MSLQSDVPGHLWQGTNNYSPVGGAVYASDTIQLTADLGAATVPDKSWVIQLFEVFNSGSSGVAELDLISEYTGKSRFVAILEGANKYYFTTMPTTGRTYKRSIKFLPSSQQVQYTLTDISSNTMPEVYTIAAPAGFEFNIMNVFRGTEWHNQVSNTTFPVRWNVALSNVVNFSAGTPQGTQNTMQPMKMTDGTRTPPNTIQSMLMTTQVPNTWILGGFILAGLIAWSMFSH